MDLLCLTVCDADECLSFAGDVAFAGASPVVLMKDAAVSVTLPSLLGWCPRPFLLGVAADAASLANGGTVTVGVIVLTDGGSELPADLAGVATVRVASLAEAGEVTLGVTGLAAAGAVSLANADGLFLAVSTEQIVIGVQTSAVWGDRFSPGVWCCDETLGWQNCDFCLADSLYSW